VIKPLISMFRIIMARLLNLVTLKIINSLYGFFPKQVPLDEPFKDVDSGMNSKNLKVKI